MDKSELIDGICEINKCARPELLTGFSEQDLHDYIEHLRQLDLVELEVCC